MLYLGKEEEEKMGKFDNCLFLSDMDGTFLDENARLLPRNMEAAQYFMDNGGYFSIATGRSCISAGEYIKKFPINAPALLYNGGLMYDYNKEKIIRAEYLPSHVDEYIRELGEAIPELCIIISKVEGDFVVQSEDSILDWYSDHERENPPIASSIEEVPGPWMKIIFSSPDEPTIDKVMEYCKRWKDVSFIRSSLLFYEMIAKGTSKGSSILYLADDLNIPYTNTFAIGDYNNDIAMISVAEIGAMPSNAPKEIQQFADLIVGPNKDGCVADFIEYLDTKY